MSRNMSLERVIEYFESTQLRVADVALQVCTRIVAERQQREDAARGSQAKTLLPPVRRRGKSRKGASLSTVVSSATPSTMTVTTGETLADA